MLVPSMKLMPSAMSCCWTRSSRRSQTPCFAQRMNNCAASHHGPSSAGMLRHFAPFWCRQKIAEIFWRGKQFPYCWGGARGGGALYARNTERSSVLVFFDIEAGKIRRQVLLPVRVRAPFIVAPSAVSMILLETPQESVGLLMVDGTIRRQGRLGLGGLTIAIPWRNYRLINVAKASTTLSVRDRNGRERIVATAPYFGLVSVARDGQAVFEQQTPGGGSSVVNHYDPTSSQIRALTSGGRSSNRSSSPMAAGSSTSTGTPSVPSSSVRCRTTRNATRCCPGVGS